MSWLATGSLFLVGLILPLEALADPVSLQEYFFELDGAQYSNTTTMPGLESGGFDTATGLGILVLTFAPGVSGAHFFDAYFDHELHVPLYNEYGSVGGAPDAGVSWQIDEPGFGDGNRVGTIFGNAKANALDNANHVPGIASNFLGDCGANGAGSPNAACNNDVSLALGFNFVLAADEKAVITFVAGQTAPPGGFYLEQLSPADGNPAQAADSLFLTGALSILPAPEPSSSLLTLTGLIGLALRARRAR
jgi:hypothetical protein